MKFYALFFLVFWMHLGVAQSNPTPTSATKFKYCKTSKCKALNSFITAEYYLDFDDIDASQKWLNVTKDYLNPAFQILHLVLCTACSRSCFIITGYFNLVKTKHTKKF